MAKMIFADQDHRGNKILNADLSSPSNIFPDLNEVGDDSGIKTPLRTTLYFRGQAVDVTDDVPNDQTIISVKDEVLPGGLTGQVLGKASDADYDVVWVDGSATSIQAGPGSPIQVGEGPPGTFTIAVATGPGITQVTGQIRADIAPGGGLTSTRGADGRSLGIRTKVGSGLLTTVNDGAFVDWTVVPTPVSINDAANKLYVDQMASGISPLAEVRAASNSDLVNIGTAPATIDGVSLTEGSRVLLRKQTDLVENGIYVVSFGALVRADDANTEGSLKVGSTVFVSEGNTNANASFSVSDIGPVHDAPWTPNVDPNVWVKTSQLTGFTEGPGIDIVSGAISVDAGDGITTANGSTAVQLAPSSGLAVDDVGLRLEGITPGIPGDPNNPQIRAARVVSGTVVALGVAGGETLTFTHNLDSNTPVAVNVSMDDGAGNVCDVSTDICYPSTNTVSIGFVKTLAAGTLLNVVVVG